ncbi:MAG: HD domain-containing protein [Elusimicrobia bacterium]|nr:HD domain-containing protein [Elusimicrobiota bacterium]
MRPTLTLPLILTLIAWPLPAGAQIKTNAGADAAAGTSGTVGTSLNAGGVAPIGLQNGSVLTPLSLSGALAPALAAPAVSLNQGLAPSALAQSPAPAAAAAEKPGSKPAQAAAAPPGTPPKNDPAAAPAGPPAGPPVYFLLELGKLGVPQGLLARLYDFLGTRHPGNQSSIYHGLGHTREVANLTARILSGRNLPAEKKILLILAAALHDVDPARAENTPARVAATLEHLDQDDEARALLLDFGGGFGFTAAQVKALIMATDFDMDPAKLQAKQDAFAKAAAEAFPGEGDWAVAWGKNLAFADQSSTYVGSLADARKRVEGLAVEIRAQLQAIGKGPGPTDEMMLAGSFKFLSVLKQNPLFALLPPEESKNFDAVLSYFQARQTPEAWQAESAPVPARAPPVNPDLAAARRFIKGIMGGMRAPTEREADSLLGDWLDENGIPRDSPRAASVRRELVPGKAAADERVAAELDPKLRRHAALLIRLAAEYGVTVPHVEAVMAKRGLIRNLDAIPDASLENQVEMALTNDELERAVAKYPDNAQGDLMRGVAGAMGVKGGKSVEEVSRDGVFLYADFNGRQFLRGYANRDPDIQSHTIAFYVTRRDGKWRIDGYRQKKSSRISDASYIDALKTWLRAGGIPSSDFK